MAAGKWKWYAKAKLALINGEIDFNSHTFKIALFLSTSNCDTLSAHDALADLTNEHASANGYSRQTLTGVVTLDTAGTISIDCDDATFNAVGGPITARHAVIYDDTHADDIPVVTCVLDTTPADVTATSGNPLNIQMPADGLFDLSGATTD